jgi:SAM-dependent methyltransferase/uncharacterized membrane protein YbhN (UPF0104 family)
MSPSTTVATMKTAVKAAVSLSLLGYLASRCDLTGFSRALHAARPLLLLPALLGTLLFVCVTTVRFRLILRDNGEPLPAYPVLLKYYLMGLFFSFLAPGGVAGDVVKVAKLSRHRRNLGFSIQSVLLERVLGFLALLTLGSIFLFGHESMETLPASLLRIVLILLALGYAGLFGLLAGLHRRIPWPRQAREGIAAIRPWTVLRAFLLSFLLQGINLSVYFAVYRALPVPADFPRLIPAILAGSVAAMLPISIQGLGVNESIFAKMLVPQGVPIETAMLLSLLVFLMGLAVGLVGGILFVLEGETAAAPESARHRKLQIDHYRGLAGEFDQRFRRENRNHFRKIKAIVDHLDLREGDRVLELGAGTGIHGKFLLDANLGKHVSYVGTDLSREMVAASRARLAGLSAQLLCCDGENLPFPDGTFDAAYISGSLHHFGNLERGVGEIVRILKPGGRFCIMEPNWIFPTNFLPSKLVAAERNISQIRPGNFRAWFSGFPRINYRIRNFAYTPPFPVFLHGLFDRMDEWLARLPGLRGLSVMLFVTGEKQ